MPDNKNLRGPADRSRVNVHEPYELKYWSDKWNVTTEQLRAAVNAVGPMAHNVAAHLDKRL